MCNNRHLWDEDLVKWRVVEKLDSQTEVFHYVLNSMAPHPQREFCELRYVLLVAITLSVQQQCTAPFIKSDSCVITYVMVARVGLGVVTGPGRAVT